jgi:DNA polymerase III delta subunit
MEKAEVFAGGQSLFETKKLLILDNCFEAEQKRLKLFLKRYADEPSTIILIEAAGKPPKPLDFILKKPAFHEDFGNLAGKEWDGFVRGKLKEFGIGIDPAALALLSGLYAKNTWGLIKELEKLAAWGKPVIAEKDLALLDLELTPNYWGLLQGLKHASAAARLSSLERLFSQHEPAGKLFNILSAMWSEKIAAFAAYDGAVKGGKLDYEEALLDLAIS